MKILPRKVLVQRVNRALRRSPVVALLGPRQSGKTTLALEVTRKERTVHRFDLERPVDEARLRQPQRLLESLRGLVVLDEIQRQAGLLPLLRVLADRRPLSARFLILGSASPSLVKGASETLAGRVEFVEMGGFDLGETGVRWQDRLWLRGGFPRSFLARSEMDSEAWRENFIQTLLERDIPQLGFQIPAPQLRRFWTMVAHYHGQMWNASEIAGSIGLTHPTAQRYLDILTGAFLVRQLTPWFENLGKRIVKASKVYVRDSGILHSLLRVDSWPVLEAHPKLGASWEGFAMEQILRLQGGRDAYFWGTHAGAELDLLLIRHGKRWGFEFKCNDAPVVTKSMRIAMQDLKLAHLWVVYPGNRGYPMERRIDCVSLSEVLQLKV